MQTIGKTGHEWSEVVNELEWAGDDNSFTTVERQLPGEYWTSPDVHFVTVDATTADHILNVVSDLANAEQRQQLADDLEMTEEEVEESEAVRREQL